jgi:hypothetical protein
VALVADFSLSFLLPFFPFFFFFFFFFLCTSCVISFRFVFCSFSFIIYHRDLVAAENGLRRDTEESLQSKASQTSLEAAAAEKNAKEMEETFQKTHFTDSDDKETAALAVAAAAVEASAAEKRAIAAQAEADQATSGRLTAPQGDVLERATVQILRKYGIGSRSNSTCEDISAALRAGKPLSVWQRSSLLYYSLFETTWPKDGRFR